MKSIYHGLLTAVLLVSLAVFGQVPEGRGADPVPPKAEVVEIELGTSVTVELGRKCILTAETKAKKVTWKVPAGVDAMPLDGKRLAVWAKEGRYVFVAMAPSGDEVVSAEVVLTVVGPRPPPVPPGPTPDPVPPTPPPVPPPAPDPKPLPVTSFHVILVWESGAGLTKEQNAVFNGVVVESFLDSKCTKDGGGKGWRRRDKDQATTGDTPTMNALWEAVKPKVTSVPCIAIEVNGKVVIEPLAATPALQVEALKKYIGEK